jgi:DNA-binding GntR family transcriptional regulator
VAWKNTRAAEIGVAVLREHQRIHAATRRGDAMAARAAAQADFSRASGRLARRGDLAD